MKIEKGFKVISQAGRDSGKIFFVADFPRENYVSLVDGKLRKLESPKQKKIKHIKIFSSELCYVGRKLTGDEKVTNAEIRKALKKCEDAE